MSILTLQVWQIYNIVVCLVFVMICIPKVIECLRLHFVSSQCKEFRIHTLINLNDFHLKVCESEEWKEFPSKLNLINYYFIFMKTANVYFKHISLTFHQSEVNERKRNRQMYWTRQMRNMYIKYSSNTQNVHEWNGVIIRSFSCFLSVFIWRFNRKLNFPFNLKTVMNIVGKYSFGCQCSKRLIKCNEWKRREMKH